MEVKILGNVQMALQYLKTLQQRTGAFSHQTKQIRGPKTKAQLHSSPFLTAIIVDLLSITAKNSTLNRTRQEIMVRANQFLLSQASPLLSWNYWKRHSEESKKRPYPDDLDTTSCVLNCLFQTDPTIFTGDKLAKLVHVFAQNELGEGGPYRTWLVTEQAPNFFQDVDVVVNANILRWWSNWEVTLPTTATWLTHMVQESFPLASPYYVGPYPVIFFLSFIAQIFPPRLWHSTLEKHLDKYPPHNLLEELLITFAMLRTRTVLAGSSLLTHHLLAKKYSVLSLKKSFLPFIQEPLFNKEPGWAGSTAFSIALWLAVTHLQKLQSLPSTLTKKKVKKVSSSASAVVESALARVQNQVAELPEPLSSQAAQQLQNAWREKAFQKMVLFPWSFGQSLVPRLRQKSKTLSNQFWVELGLGTVYGWFAYTLYDEVLDHDRPPVFLGLANFWNRQMMTTTQFLADHQPDIHSFLQRTLNQIDAANTWEFMECRFPTDTYFQFAHALPDFGRCTVLAEKSFGHALGPLCALEMSGFGISSQEFQAALQFWQSYLIAKQLNDDTHDWADDFVAGRHTPITVHLLKKYRLLHPRLQQRKVTTLKEELNVLFWSTEVIPVCEMLSEYLQQARVAAEQLKMIVKPKFFSNLLAPLEQAVQKAKQEHLQTKSFLYGY